MRWVRPWLGCVALLYPAYWAATLLIALASMAGGAGAIRISPFGAIVPLRRPDWTITAIVVIIAVTISFIRVWPIFAGLLIAVTGAALWAMRMPWIAAAVLIALGLRKILDAAPDSRYFARVAFLIAAVALPLAFAALVLPRPFTGRLLAPSIAAAILAMVVALRWRAVATFRMPGWRPVAAGVAASALLLTATPPIGRVLAESQRRTSREHAREAVAGLPLLSAAAPFGKVFFQRGVSLTAEFPDGYLSETARETLRMLPKYGVNAIALVPYGNINSPDRFGGDMESDEGIENLSRIAHSVGMTVMLKPQLWGRTWPAEFDAQDPTAWFAAYGRFVDHYAQLAARIHADLFCMGTELAKMTRHEAQWRSLIARARKQYRGPITYAAIQGPEFEQLRFWDALDYVGLSNYYPLPDNLDTAAVVAKVEAVQKRTGKPLIFAEAGFSSFESPQRAPWDESPRRLAPSDQARCYEALFKAFYLKPWFQGVYWWKVGTNRFGGLNDGSHTPWGKPAMDVLKKWYTTGGR